MNTALIVLDTVRRDRFKDYATRLNNKSDIEINCYSTSSWTVPSHASMLTGQVPSEHGVNSSNTNFSSLSETFLDKIPQRTYGVSTNGWLSPAFEFDEYFDRFAHFHGSEELVPGGIDIVRFLEENSDSHSRHLKFLLKAIAEGRLSESLANALWIKLNNSLKGNKFPRLGDYGVKKARKEAIDMVDEEPFFLFMNVVDAHGPHENLRVYGDNNIPNEWSSTESSVWEVNENPEHEYLRNYSDLYDESIRYLDKEISILIDELLEYNTTIIITSDHGEGLDPRKDGVFGHKLLNQAVTNVPFLIINPPEVPEDTPDIFSHLDLPEVVKSISEGSLKIPERHTIQLERVGDPDTEDEYWNRTMRGLWKDGQLEFWDKPNSLDNEFSRSIEDVDNSETTRVSKSAEKHLKDLGYL